MESVEPKNHDSAEQPNKPAYRAPKIVDLGKVESLTKGSREQTSDEPNAGYQGG